MNKSADIASTLRTTPARSILKNLSEDGRSHESYCMPASSLLHSSNTKVSFKLIRASGWPCAGFEQDQDFADCLKGMGDRSCNQHVSSKAAVVGSAILCGLYSKGAQARSPIRPVEDYRGPLGSGFTVQPLTKSTATP